MRSIIQALFGGPEVHGHRTVSPVKIGVAFIILVLVSGWVMFNKSKVTTWVTPGDSFDIRFAREYRLFPYNSKVKVNFVPVGVVTGSEEQDDGTSLVSVKVSKDVRDKLGTEPRAVLRPTTLLGGNYMVDLIPGGQPGRFIGGVIPTERTMLPVELDKITKALQPNALQGLRSTVTRLDETLQGGGREALQRLVSDAPGALKPTAEAVQALRGANPEHDLTDVVDGLENTARELSSPPGRLDAILADLASTSAAFGRRAPEVSATLDRLPGALHDTDAGLKRLNHTLDILEDTADDIRPTARELRPTLDKIDPVLARARPVIHDLRDVLHDLRPLVEDLSPVSEDLTDVFDDLHGPVLDRVNGPISALLLNSYHGSGPFMNTHTDKPIFQEVVYALANLDRAGMMDRNGGTVPFQPGPVVEPFENLIQNDGRPRMESLENQVVDPLKFKPPVQVPPQPPHAAGENKTIPMLGGAAPAPGGQGR